MTQGLSVRQVGSRSDRLDPHLLGRWKNLTIALYREQDGSKICDVLGELQTGDLFVHESVKYRITQVQRNPRGGQRALCLPVEVRQRKQPGRTWMQSGS